MDIEFNLNGYRKLIRHLMSHYAFIDFGRCFTEEPEPFIILRHDVDYSLEKALMIAQVEAKELGIRSTYFVLHSSPHYTILDPEAVRIIREIHCLGHTIGFHYDCNLFSLAENPELLLEQMIEIVENLCQVEVTCISCHNPDITTRDLFIDTPRYLNAYSPAFKDGMSYISDSLGVWRRDTLAKLWGLSMSKIQLLLHPCFWSGEKVFDREQFLWDMRTEKIVNVERYINWQRDSWNSYLQRRISCQS